MALDNGSQHEPKNNLVEPFPSEDKIADRVWDSFGPEWIERSRESVKWMEGEEAKARRLREGDADDD